MKAIHRPHLVLAAIAVWVFGFSHLRAESEPTPPPTSEATPAENWKPTWPKLKEFDSYPAAIQDVVRMAFEMHDLGLGYEYGSADPVNGGMDCSGSVYYVLQMLGWKNVPRPSDGIYRWVWEAGTFTAVNGTTFDSYEWKNLKPGDLLFWVGTYHVDAKRDPPISHVMIYLGKNAESGERIIYGASEGRRYQGERRSGVGLFDFDLPPPHTAGEAGSHFIGYSPIPQPHATR